MKMWVSYLSLQQNELFRAQDCTQRWMYLYSYSPHKQNVATWTHAQDYASRWMCSAIILTSLTSLASRTPMQMNISCTCCYLFSTSLQHEFLHDCMQRMSGVDACYCKHFCCFAVFDEFPPRCWQLSGSRSAPRQLLWEAYVMLRGT